MNDVSLPSMMVFLGITVVYSVYATVWTPGAQAIAKALRTPGADGPSNPGSASMWFYVMAVLVGQCLLGVSVLTTQCGGNSSMQDVQTLALGLFYWLIVFVTVAGLLAARSTGASWRAPFANGVLAFSGWGVPRAVVGLSKGKAPSAQEAYDIASALSASTYVSDARDPNFMSSDMTPVVRTALSTPLSAAKVAKGETPVAVPWENLVTALVRRDAISNIIWLTLAGALAATMYASVLADSKCSLSADQMKKLYEAGVRNQQKADAEAADQKVYKFRD